jgi:hypothetical protein
MPIQLERRAREIKAIACKGLREKHGSGRFPFDFACKSL